MISKVIAFFLSWATGFIFLVLILAIGQLYYPIHSWLFTGEWRWDSFERSMRFYKACIPASFIGAVVYTIKEYVDVKLKSKNKAQSNRVNGYSMHRAHMLKAHYVNNPF